jgi:hypothetical protein
MGGGFGMLIMGWDFGGRNKWKEWERGEKEGEWDYWGSWGRNKKEFSIKVLDFGKNIWCLEFRMVISKGGYWVLIHWKLIFICL